jgi:surface protein
MRIGIGNTIPERVSLPGQSGGVVIPNEFIFEVNAAIGDTIDLQTKDVSSAADFVINWGEGSDETINAETASHTYTSSGTKVVKINKAGTNTPVNNFAVLATNEGRSMVTKISNWGNNEWYKLRDAFSACTNLTVIDSASQLLTASNASQLFYNTFRSCTGLTVADMSNWATNNVVWYLRGTFQGCTNVSLVKAPSSRVMPVNYFGSVDASAFTNSPFRYVGSNVTDGATFEFEGLDFTQMSYAYITYAFANTRINGNTSSFSNWKFSSNIDRLTNLFYLASVRGTNPTLDCSGWTTFQGRYLNGTFRGLGGSTGLSLNLSNLNVSNVTDMGLMMGHTHSPNSVANMIGLSTWGATGGGVNMSFAFARMRYLKLTADDNFSDAFINSLLPTTVASTFRQMGESLSSPYGEPPNLASLDLSNCSSLNSMFYRSRFSNLSDFTNVTFPTSTADFSNFMRDIITSSVTAHLDFSNKTFKPSGLSRAFETFRSANKITFPSGSNSDFSSLTNISYAFNNAGSNSRELEVVLPTDADYSAVTSWVNTFNNLNGPGTDTLTTCVGDTLIRRLHATSLNANQQSLNLGTTKLTGSPSVVDSNVIALETAGWTITSNSTDAAMPFVYTIPLTAGTPATPTGSFTGGTFSSSNSNIAVNATTGEINTPNAGNTTIRYTLADGCYNEQAIVVNLVLAQLNNVYSMDFDGINDYINTDSITLGNTFTFSFWVKARGFQTNPAPLGSANYFSSGFNGNFIIRIRSNQFLLASYNGNSTATQELITATPSPSISIDEWHHIVLTNDGTTAVFYLDGLPLTTTGVNTKALVDLTNGFIIGDGDQRAVGNDPWSGQIDEVAIFNVELSAQEVQDIYNATETGKTADLNDLTTPPIKWYRMGD